MGLLYNLHDNPSTTTSALLVNAESLKSDWRSTWLSYYFKYYYFIHDTSI